MYVCVSICLRVNMLHMCMPRGQKKTFNSPESQSVVSCLRRVLRELRSSRQAASAHNC